MSIMVTKHYMVRDVYAIPFQTEYGIGFHYISCISDLHVHKMVPLKRFRYPQNVSSKPSKPSVTIKSPSKPDPVNEKPIEALSQEGEFFDGSVTMGAAPSPRHVPIPIFLQED